MADTHDVYDRLASLCMHYVRTSSDHVLHTRCINSKYIIKQYIPPEIKDVYFSYTLFFGSKDGSTEAHHIYIILAGRSAGHAHIRSLMTYSTINTTYSFLRGINTTYLESQILPP